MVGDSQLSALQGEIAKQSIKISVFCIASARILYSSMSERNILRMRIISAPERRRNATASKVRTPGLFIKLFVSTIIPE